MIWEFIKAILEPLIKPMLIMSIIAVLIIPLTPDNRKLDKERLKNN